MIKIKNSKSYLDLELDGIRLTLRVDDYVNYQNKEESIYNYLCHTEMLFSFENQHTSFSPFADCLFCFEVDILADMITKHLSNEYNDIECYRCVSPDLYFLFYPKNYKPTKREILINHQLESFNFKTNTINNTHNCMELYLTFVLNGLYGKHQLKVVFSNDNLKKC